MGKKYNHIRTIEIGLHPEGNIAVWCGTCGCYVYYDQFSVIDYLVIKDVVRNHLKESR